MNLYNLKKPLVGDSARTYLLTQIIPKSNSNTKILDIGCGTCALWDPILPDIEFELWGLDIDSDSVGTAKKIVKNPDLMKVGDVNHLLDHFPSDFFDIVISTQVIYYFNDLSHIFNDVHKILKNHGLFIFTTELPKRPACFLDTVANNLSSVSGYLYRKNLYRKPAPELLSLLANAHFEVKTVKFFHIPPLKHVHNHIIQNENKNTMMMHWVALEEELNQDPSFSENADKFCRSVYIEAQKMELR